MNAHASTASTPFWRLGDLTDAELLEDLASLVQSHRRGTARLVAHLAEVEQRRLHLRAACPSMFAYCTERLRLSEDEACRRIDAARIATKFPAAYALLDGGRVTLSVLCLLKGLLTDANHEELLAGVSGKSYRAAREWLAARFPQPDVPTTIRKLPAPVAPSTATAPPSSITPPSPHRGPAPPRRQRGRIDPLSESRYRFQFTAGRTVKDQLELARDLMSHSRRGVDLGDIVERALPYLIDALMKERFGETSRPRAPRDSSPAHVTQATKRAIVERDGLGCSYVDQRGRRCGARAFLQHDHVQPLARGGASGLDNMRQLCAAHNLWMAELTFGRGHVARAIARRRARDGSLSRAIAGEQVAGSG